MTLILISLSNLILPHLILTQILKQVFKLLGRSLFLRKNIDKFLHILLILNAVIVPVSTQFIITISSHGIIQNLAQRFRVITDSSTLQMVLLNSCHTMKMLGKKRLVKHSFDMAIDDATLVMRALKSRLID